MAIELPRAVLGLVLGFLDHGSVHRLERTSKHAKHSVGASGEAPSAASAGPHS